MTRKKFLAGAAGMAATVVAAGAAMAQVPPTRTEVGSARNLVHVRTALEGLIDQLQRDQVDYGGFRVRAIQSLQHARADIVAALQWDATHPH
ncbi:MAG TPA: hypothetical protein VGX75_03480 [bacterium]|jgi:hypothetical protein|nr:hypothetical protein [bacterium]